MTLGLSATALSITGAIAASSALCISARADIPPYTLVGSFALPSGAWDIGPDGLVWGLSGSNIVRQTAPNTGAYATLGSVAPGVIGSFGASFFRLDATGSNIAIGDGNFNASSRVHFLSTSSLSTGASSPTQSVLSGNYDAVWSGSNLFVAGAGTDFVPFVNRMTFTDAATPPTSTRVINTIGGGSGGVALRNNALYTGVGFSGAGLPEGQIRSFPLATLSGSSSVNFSAGAVVTTLLSASQLGFDASGNLLVGGSYSNDGSLGAAAIVDASNLSNILRLQPAGPAAFSSYGITFNNVTGELLVTLDGTAYRYAVPTPGAMALLATSGVIASRRRRRA